MNTLRHFMTLVEAALVEAPQAGLYMHVTPLRNVPSILKKGLIPNNGGTGNYDDYRWVSLNGVYASKSADHLKGYLRGNGIVDFAVILIEVENGNALPDEDIIEIILRNSMERLGHENEIDPYELEDPEDPFFDKLALEFHKEAGGQGSPPQFLRKLVDYWTDYEIFQGGDTDPDVWMDLKDKATRFYHDARVGDHTHSVRIPHAVGFTGPTHIKAIVSVKGRDTKVIYGDVPEAAWVMMGDLVRT